MTLLRGSGIGPLVSLEDGRKLLDTITVDNGSTEWAESELVGTEEIRRRFGISRGTIYSWVRMKSIIALRNGGRLVYPVRQFEAGKPILGLGLLAVWFSTAEEAWEWLVIPNRMTGGPPIETFRVGEIMIAVRAAEGALDYAW